MNLKPDTHLFARNYSSEHTANFYSGTVDNLPNSFVSLHYKRSGVVEGTIHLGNDLGALHIDSLSSYHQDDALVKRSMVLYHTSDMIPNGEREKRRLLKRQANTPLTMDALEYIKRINVALRRFLRLESSITRDGTQGLVNSNTLEKRQNTQAASMDAKEYMHRIVVALTRYLRLRPTIIRDGSNEISNSNNFVAPTFAIDTSVPPAVDTGATALDNAMLGTALNSTAPALSKRQTYSTDQQPGYSTDPNVYPQYTSSNGQPQYASSNDQPQYTSSNGQPQYASSNDQPQYTSSNGQPQYTSSTGQPQYYTNTGQPQYDPNSSPQSEAAPQNNCVMSLIADYSYFQRHGEDSESKMMQHVAAISQYYQQQLGIAMSVSFVYIARGGDDYGFNAIPNDADTIVPYINAAAAHVPGLDADNMCIIAVFSSTDLSDGAVGVSYVGTVCQPGGNVLIIQDRGGTMSGAEMTAIVMHEVGHSLGAAHDDPNGQCDPTPGGENHFVMYPVVSKCADMNTLSSCSLSAIQTNLQKPQAQCWASSTRGRSGYRSKRVVHSEQQVIFN